MPRVVDTVVVTQPMLDSMYVIEQRLREFNMRKMLLNYKAHFHLHDGKSDLVPGVAGTTKTAQLCNLEGSEPRGFKGDQAKAFLRRGEHQLDELKAKKRGPDLSDEDLSDDDDLPQAWHALCPWMTHPRTAVVPSMPVDTPGAGSSTDPLPPAPRAMGDDMSDASRAMRSPIKKARKHKDKSPDDAQDGVTGYTSTHC